MAPTNHKKPALKIRHKMLKKFWVALPLVGVLAGAYLLVLVYSPELNSSSPRPQSQWNEPVPQKAKYNEQRVYIPRLNLNLRYEDSQRALDTGLWHRYPERGDPKKGGNFILAGHRFQLGFTPGETVQKSPLYHVDQVQVGDYIYVDFEGSRYRYEVTKRYTVKPQQTEIEAASTQAKMTLYTCTFSGESDGREVLEAELVEKNIGSKLKVGTST